MREIEFTIDENGHVTVDMNGFHGKGCEEVAKQLAKALGTTVNKSVKPAYWKPEIETKGKVRLNG